MKKIIVASMNYEMPKHKSFEDFKKVVQAQVAEAVKNKAEILLYPEYGSIELVSLMDHWTQKNLHKQLDEIQKYRDDFFSVYQNAAKLHQVVNVAPSFPYKLENGEFRNRAYVFFPDGSSDYQEKTMMTRFENEEWKITKGDGVLKVFEYRNFKFGINICYDVEFADFALKLCQNGAEMIFVPSCTETHKGMNRVHIGARARALENQCYVIVSQTINKVDYSEAIDFNTGKVAFYSTCDIGFPDDGILLESEINKPGWNYYQLDFELIQSVRKSGNVFNFADQDVLSKRELRTVRQLSLGPA